MPPPPTACCRSPFSSLVRDVSTGTALTSFKSNACPPNGLSLLGRDYLVAAQAGRGGGLHFWAWHKDQPHLRSFAAEQLTAVAATRDGVYCAAGGASGAVFVWETSSGRLLRTWPAHYKVRCGHLPPCEHAPLRPLLTAPSPPPTAGCRLSRALPFLTAARCW